MKIKLSEGISLHFNEVDLLATNLKLNGLDNFKLFCTRNTLLKKTNSNSVDTILYNQTLTLLDRDLNSKTINVIEYPNNCSAIFIDYNEFSFDELFLLAACAGFTFLFSNYNLFGDSIKITEELYFLHIKPEYTFVRTYYETTGHVNIFTETVIKDIDIKGEYKIHSPYNNNINFVYSFYKDPKNIKEKHSFLIHRIKETDKEGDKFENYELFYIATANRTGNKLGILISEDLI